MILRQLIVSLSLVQYGLAAPSIMESLQNVGVDRAPIRLSSDQSASIRQELGHPINERDRDEFLFKHEIEKRIRVRYHVPLTETTISVRIHHQLLDRVELLRVITSTMIDIQNVLFTSGDGPLSPNSDPYVIRFPSNIQFRVKSSTAHQLTYQIIFNALRGLLQILINQNQNHEVNFDIIQRGMGILGWGFILLVRNDPKF